MSVTGFTIFCDDIRFEANGKAIIIGAYQEDLIPSQLPQTLLLSFWVRLFGMPQGDSNLELRIGANGMAQHTLSITIDVENSTKPANMFFGGVPLNIQESGKIFIEISGLPDGETFRDALAITPVIIT